MTKSFKQFIKENDSKKPTPISLLIGRFNPPHLGHLQMVEMMKHTPMILIVEGKDSSNDKERNPLTGVERERLIKKMVPGAKTRIVYSANLSPIRFHLEKSGEYQIAEIMAGPDRIPSYQKQLKDYADRIEFTETPRVTSATTVREAIRDGDEAKFKKLMPRQLWGEWDTMVQKLKEVSGK